MPADWWSVTLYNSDNFLPDNNDDALSYDATRAGDGQWEVIIAADSPRDEDAWISSRNAGQFDLTLRLYIPEVALIEAPETTLKAPTLTRFSCTGESE